MTSISSMTCRTTTLFLVVSLTTIVIVCLVATCPQFREVARFDCGKGRSLVIKEECEWEVLLCLYYEVHIGETIVVPLTGFSGVDPMEQLTGRFEIVHALGGDLVCIVEKDPNIGDTVVIMHNFATNESWPYVEDADVSYSKRSIAKTNRLYQQASAEHPDLPPL